MSIKNILSLRIQSIDIPNSWYNFSKKMKNTQFIIKTHDRINISGETKYRENLSWTKTTKIEGKTFVIKIPEGKSAWTLLFVGPKRTSKRHAKYPKNP